MSDDMIYPVSDDVMELWEAQIEAFLTKSLTDDKHKLDISRTFITNDHFCRTYSNHPSLGIDFDRLAVENTGCRDYINMSARPDIDKTIEMYRVVRKYPDSDKNIDIAIYRECVAVYVKYSMVVFRSNLLEVYRDTLNAHIAESSISKMDYLLEHFINQ
jgi:hypothetical protein